MKRINYIILVISTLLLSSASGYSSQRYFHIRMNTNKGEIILLLYNQTPLHRDNFVKLSKEGYFNGVLFHRVINDFMIQSGDPDSPAHRLALPDLAGPERATGHDPAPAGKNRRQSVQHGVDRYDDAG